MGDGRYQIKEGLVCKPKALLKEKSFEERKIER
jgi:hypothetical protein